MISTERKLDEAKYFLSKLKISDPYFDYILSAFLNAARSTPWIMRHEFHKISGWEEWYELTEVTIEQKRLLNKINELRILCTKQSGVKTEYYMFDAVVPDEKYYSEIEKMLKDFEGEEISIIIKEIDDSVENFEKEDDNETFVFRGSVKLDKDTSENSRESILELCQSYIEFLEMKVNECVTKFPIFK
jgi:hypothetical protein